MQLLTKEKPLVVYEHGLTQEKLCQVMFTIHINDKQQGLNNNYTSTVELNIEVQVQLQVQLQYNFAIW